MNSSSSGCAAGVGKNLHGIFKGWMSESLLRRKGNADIVTADNRVSSKTRTRESRDIHTVYYRTLSLNSNRLLGTDGRFLSVSGWSHMRVRFRAALEFIDLFVPHKWPLADRSPRSQFTDTNCEHLGQWPEASSNMRSRPISIKVVNSHLR